MLTYKLQRNEKKWKEMNKKENYIFGMNEWMNENCIQQYTTTIIKNNKEIKQSTCAHINAHTSKIHK